MSWQLPVGFLAGLEGEHADVVARCITGSFGQRHVRDDSDDTDRSSLCLTVEQWRQRSLTTERGQ